MARYKNVVMTALLIALFLSLAGMAYGEMNGETILASRILDADVLGENQEVIGEVDDIIIRRSGRVKKLTVEFSGFLDIGDKLVALSSNKFRFQNGNLSVHISEKDLSKMKDFDYYRHGLLPGYYYRARPYPGRYRNQRYYFNPDSPYQEPEFNQWHYSPSRFLASVVMDRNLINEQGEPIGTVKDLLIHINDKKLDKIIIHTMDVLGKDIHVALPYQPLGFADTGMVYDIRRGELKDLV